MNRSTSLLTARVIRFLRGRLAPRPIILMYHRVVEVDLDPWALCVTPQHFAEHLEVLRSSRRPTSLRNLVAAHRRGRPPAGAVTLTFDDGYADNYLNARPLLEKYQIPATIFVTSGQVGSQREFWWDELERILLRPGMLPEHLGIELEGRTCRWALGAAVTYSAERRERDRHRRAWDGEPGSRLAFYYAVWSELRTLPYAAQRRALDQIGEWAQADAQMRPAYRQMTEDELAALHKGRLVEIGAHTVTHPSLPFQPEEIQRRELVESRKALETMIDHPVTSFSYPFGDHSPEVDMRVRDAGYCCACTTVATGVSRTTDLMSLPRFEVRDWSGAELARRLENWRYR